MFWIVVYFRMSICKSADSHWLTHRHLSCCNHLLEKITKKVLKLLKTLGEEPYFKTTVLQPNVLITRSTDYNIANYIFHAILSKNVKNQIWLNFLNLHFFEVFINLYSERLLTSIISFLCNSLFALISSVWIEYAKQTT